MPRIQNFPSLQLLLITLCHVNSRKCTKTTDECQFFGDFPLQRVNFDAKVIAKVQSVSFVQLAFTRTQRECTREETNVNLSDSTSSSQTMGILLSFSLWRRYPKTWGFVCTLVIAISSVCIQQTRIHIAPENQVWISRFSLIFTTKGIDRSCNLTFNGTPAQVRESHCLELLRVRWIVACCELRAIITPKKARDYLFQLCKSWYFMYEKSINRRL